MAQIDDLHAAVDAVTAAVDAVAARVDQLIADQPAAPDFSADVASLNDAVAKLGAVAPAAPVDETPVDTGV